MIAKECASCGGRFSAKSAKAIYCSPRCRVRATRQRQRDAVSPPPPQRREGPPLVSLVPRAPKSADEGFAADTRRELEAADRLDGYLGRAAMYLAGILDASPGDTGGGHAALIREYKASMAAALDGADAAMTPLERIRRERELRTG